MEGGHWTFSKEAKEETVPFLSPSPSCSHAASLSEVVGMVTFQHAETLPTTLVSLSSPLMWPMRGEFEQFSCWAQW